MTQGLGGGCGQQTVTDQVVCSLLFDAQNFRCCIYREVLALPIPMSGEPFLRLGRTQDSHADRGRFVDYRPLPASAHQSQR